MKSARRRLGCCSAVVCAMTLSFGCTDTSSFTADKEKDKQKSVNSSPAESKIEADESVVIPTNITGALLTCANEQNVDDSRNEAFLGCRFEKNDGTKLSVKTIAAEVAYGYLATPDTSVSVQMKPLVEDPRYDVIYLMLGNSKEAVKTALDRFVISWRLLGGITFDGNLTLERRFRDTERSASDIFEIKGDYESIRSQMLDDLNNGNVSAPVAP